jgi:hypothetical protein
MTFAPPVTDEELRAAGFTAAARNFPMSEKAVRLLSKQTGVPFEKMPAAWHYAPNTYVLEQMERDSC